MSLFSECRVLREKEKVRAGEGGNAYIWSMRAHGKITYPRNEDVNEGFLEEVH